MENFIGRAMHGVNIRDALIPGPGLNKPSMPCFPNEMLPCIGLAGKASIVTYEILAPFNIY